MTRSIIWTIGELADILRERQKNNFDVNIGVSGKRGNGKSTFINKLLLRFKDEGFNQYKHQVYERDDVINLLGTQTYGFCWDDEAINSGYKRDFQSTGQKDLIKIITNYRDNYNIYISALPFFYSLDKDLRALMFLHVHIIERGVAVLFMPLPGLIHNSDPWDSDRNMKVEKKENERIAKNPKLSFRYHKFTTFIGYLYFNDITDAQKEIYKAIKKEKREKRFKLEESKKGVVEDFNTKCFRLMKEKKLTMEGLRQVCVMEGKKYSAVYPQLARMLKDEGSPLTPAQYIDSYMDVKKMKESAKASLKIAELIGMD